MGTVENNRHVIVKRARETRLLFVRTGTTGGIGKVKFDFGDLIGRRFGVPYEVRQKKLHPCSMGEVNVVDLDDEEIEVADIGEEETSEREECQHVEKMRRGPASSHQIITKLAASKPSFRHKTVYAKEKYLTKKAKKYSSVIVVYPPSIRQIHEVYYSKDSDKIAYLRQDCLAHLLTWSNVHYGCRVAVLEQCLGIVTAAVLERMAGGGQCVRLHKGQTLQSIPCLAAMDFHQTVLATLLPVPVEDFVNLEVKIGETEVTAERKPKVEENGEKTAADEEHSKQVRREQRESQKTIGKGILREAALDSFIIAMKEHPMDMMQRLIGCTRPARPFVVYCSYVQPLLECYQWIREEGKAVNVQLLDNFYRKHQVLPGRSHPEMNQPVAAGFILTGITVSQ